MQKETDPNTKMVKQPAKIKARKGSIKPNWKRIERTEQMCGWDLRNKGEQVAMRDIEKPIQQLLADIHEAHQQREEDLEKRKKCIEKSDTPVAQERDPALLVLFTLARTSSMMANVALSNRRTNNILLFFTFIVTVCTIVMTVLTWLLYCRG